MATKQDVLTELDSVTDKISSQVRTTAIAVLALSWGLLVGNSAAAQSISTQLRPTLVALGVGSIVVLFCDFLQYFAGYFSTKETFDEIERSNKNEGKYNYESLPYKLRKFFFWAKQVLLIATVSWLLVALGFWIVRGL